MSVKKKKGQYLCTNFEANNQWPYKKRILQHYYFIMVLTPEGRNSQRCQY